MTDVFISYAHEDHAYVRIMAPALEAEGFTVWWDHTIPPGKTWDEVIAKGIADARCCIVLWSQSSVVSDWVKEEATIAKDHRKFIPVQIDNSEPPVGFRRIQAAHLQNWTGNVNEPQWQMLVREIRSVISASPGAGSGSAGAAPSGQSYAPRSYAPPPPPAQTRSGPPPLAIGAMVVAGLVALAAVLVNVLPRGEESAATPGPEIVAEAPPAAAGPDPEVERLRMERDEAVRRAAAERQTREQEAARLQRERDEAIAAQERARQAELRRQEEARLAASNIDNSTWSLRRRFTHGPDPPREWFQGVDMSLLRGGVYSDEGGARGTWSQRGRTVTFALTGGNETTYTGTLSADGRSIVGTFRNNRGESGDFRLSRIS